MSRSAIARWLLLAGDARADLRFDVFRQDGFQATHERVEEGLRLGVTDPLGLRAYVHQPVPEGNGNHQQQDAAGGTEQEAQRAVQRSDPAVDDEVGNTRGDEGDEDQRDDEDDAG